MNSFWENENNVSEYELLEESMQESIESIAEPPVYQKEDIDESELEEIVENSSFDLDEKEATTVFNARLRLEQANLYEMLINHDLFSGVEANKQAIENVQNELKAFIVTRLELLLGIRKPIKEVISPTKEVDIDIPASEFNEIEVEFLKALAYKGTNGRSSESAPKSIQPAKLQQSTSKKNSIQPLSLGNKVKAKSPPAKKPVEKKPVEKKRVEKKPVEKKFTKKRTVAKKPVAKKSEKPSTVEEIAKADLEEMKNRKPLSKMNAKEKAKYIEDINSKYRKKGKPTGAIDMVSPEQQEAMYLTKQQKQGAFGDDFAKMNSMIANALMIQKSQGDY